MQSRALGAGSSTGAEDTGVDRMISGISGHIGDPENEKALTEIKSYFCDPQSDILDFERQFAVFNVVMTFIRRPLPHISKRATLDYELSMGEPNWARLRICYDVLILFVGKYPNSKSLDFPFVAELLRLCRMPDVRERTAIADLIIVWYNSRPMEQNKVLLALRRELLLLREGALPPHCGTPILVVLRYAWTHGVPSKREFLVLTAEAVVPLLGYFYLGFFYTLVRDLLVAVVDECPAFGIGTLAAAQKYFPSTRPEKAAMIAHIAVRVAAVCDRNAFKIHARVFFRAMARWITGPNYKVSLEILRMLNRPVREVSIFLREFGVIVVEEVAVAIAKVSANHPAYDVKQAAKAALPSLETTTGRVTAAATSQANSERRTQNWEEIFAATGVEVVGMEAGMKENGEETITRFITWFPGISLAFVVTPGVKPNSSQPVFPPTRLPGNKRIGEIC
jgi:hypothetical protein